MVLESDAFVFELLQLLFEFVLDVEVVVSQLLLEISVLVEQVVELVHFEVKILLCNFELADFLLMALYLVVQS